MAISRYQNLARVRYSKDDYYRQEIPLFSPASEIAKHVPFTIVEYTTDKRMDALAAEHLGNGRYWWAICMMNDLNSPFDPHLAPGMSLRIPTSLRALTKFLKGKRA